MGMNKITENMTNPDAGIKSIQDQPLFSFGYSKWKALWRMVHVSLIILFSSKIIFDWAHKENFFWFSISEIVNGMLLLIAIFLLCDLIFTREIKLYQTKIVKTWRIGLRWEVKFADAKFGAMNTPFSRTKRFYPYWISNWFTPLLGVLYDDTMLSGKDARQMNQRLAEISGRDISLFDGGGMFTTSSVSLKYFLKDGETDKRPKR